MFTGIRLQNFRSFSDQSFDFISGVNVVVGPNASGKTNLLEAVYTASQGRSFKARDLDMIKHQSPWARIDGHTSAGVRTVKLITQPLPKRVIELYGGKEYSRLPNKEKLKVVLFLPDHLRLIHGSPSRRREYIDTWITQLYPERAITMRRYERALQQRNALLKQSVFDPDQLFVWNVTLVELGSTIARWRYDILDVINHGISDMYQEVSGDTSKVLLTYATELGDVDVYAQNLSRYLQTDHSHVSGFTARGPHRDDIAVSLGGKIGAATASRGETRSLILALKSLEARSMEEKHGTRPLLLLDDVFSELDGSRRDQLSRILGNNQVLITTTDADSIAIRSYKDAHFIAM